MEEEIKIYLEKKEVIVDCARCEGTGRVTEDNPDGELCEVCNGRGVVLIAIEREPLVECKFCDGRGSAEYGGARLTCEVCEGIGQQPIAGEWYIIK